MTIFLLPHGLVSVVPVAPRRGSRVLYLLAMARWRVQTSPSGLRCDHLIQSLEGRPWREL